MLTPIDIQNKVLKTGMGYNKKDVDDFIIYIMRNYEALYKENVELKDKISTLSEGIQYYKTIETTLQKALVLAEKTSKETRDAAILKAEALEKDARVKANIIIADAKNDLETIRNQTINLIQNYESFRLQFKKLAATQMELIESESFQIYAPDLDALLSGTAEPISVSDSMEDFYPEGASPIVKDTVAQSKAAETPEMAAKEEAAGQQAYAQVMQEAENIQPQEYTQVTENIQPQEYTQVTETIQPQEYTQVTEVIQPQEYTQTTGNIQTQDSAQPQHTFMSTADLSSELEELQAFGNAIARQEAATQLQSVSEPVIQPVTQQVNTTQSVSPAPGPTQMTEVLENPYISPDLKQEGQELDQMIGDLYTDLNVRQEQNTAAQVNSTQPGQTTSDDNMFEFFSTED